MSLHQVPSLDVLVDEHVSRAARRGSLLQYGDMCRRDAAEADTADDAVELMTEALAAECRALEIETGAA